MSPTQRTLKECRARGWTAQVVERWCQHSMRRIDLYGFIDVLAMDGKQFIGIQATSTGNQSTRITKIETECQEQAKMFVRSGGRVIVWGWKKYKKSVDRKWWRLTETDLTDSFRSM